MRGIALLIPLLVALLAAPPARAQESGGSFGGSSWGGGGGGGGGFGGSSHRHSSSSGPSFAERAEARRRSEERRRDERRRDEERRREAEERRREAEEQRRQAEEQRRAEEAARARAAAERRARLLAMPPAARARELSFADAPAAPQLGGTTAVTASVRARPPRTYAAARLAPPPRLARFEQPMSMGLAGCVGVGLAIFLVPFALLITRSRTPWRSVPDTPAIASPRFAARRAPPAPSGHARRVTLAFDWSARAALQAELRAMAERTDTRSREGLHAAAGQVIELLGAHLAAARYATWELSSGDARGWFESRVGDLRARFKTDRVRVIDGQAMGAGPGAHVARPEEGEGLVVVSVLLASRGAMRFPEGVARAEDVERVLALLLPASAGEMLALEVIWSPSEENDRMSSLELERFYPELMPLGSGVGRYVCGYCRAPFPRELGRCPACGGPVEPHA